MEKSKKGKDNKKGSGKDNKKSKEDKGDEKLKTCNFVKARHILCEKLSQIEEIYKTLTDQYGKCPPSSEFGKLASEHSTCSSKKKGGELGYFNRTQMVGPFAEAAFSVPPGQISDIIKTVHGYHIILVEDRKMSVK
jgi:parvulin-like peptidyl-prolyl isomerase